jgi:hypothetical protein
VIITQTNRQGQASLNDYVVIGPSGFVELADVPFDTYSFGFSGGKRKRYPGDPGVDFAGGVRTGTNEKSRASKTTAGKRCWFERPTGSGETYSANAHQFTYQGNWATLKAACRASVADSPFILRNESGESVMIDLD